MGENSKRRAKYEVAAEDSIPPFFKLPEDISMSIFSRLSVDSILSCRCVCKNWRRLLSHPDFITMHLNHSQNRHKYLIRSYHYPQSYYLLDCEESYQGNGNGNTTPLRHRDFPLENRHPAVIVGSANGLVCMSIDHSKEGHPHNHKIVLWNPSTGDYKILPDANPKVDTSSQSFGNFMLVGFGYDSFSKDYKLVRVIFGHRYQVDVYSLKTNSWKVIESTPHNKFTCSNNVGGVTVNGCIYWPICRERRGYNWILSFDLKDEKFRELQFPPTDTGVHGRDDYVVLRAMGGCLGLYFFSVNNKDKNIRSDVIREDHIYLGVWMMRKDGEKDEWTKLLFSSWGALWKVHGQPICCFQNRKVLVCIPEFEYMNEHVKLVVYDLKLNKVIETIEFHRICNGDDLVRSVRSPNRAFCMKSVTYIETLVSPNASVF